MRIQKLFLVLTITCLLFGLRDVAKAQAEDTKIEVGVQFSVLRNGLTNGFNDTSTGGGGRVTYDFNRYLAVEAEMNYFPGNGFYNVNRWQGQFGLKSGLRFSRIGFFGKARPGFVRNAYEIPLVCVQAPCDPIRGDKADFSLDLGGVVEVYPANRVTVRFDVGDLIAKRLIVPDPRALVLRAPQRQHTLQVSAGIGFRF